MSKEQKAEGAGTPTASQKSLTNDQQTVDVFDCNTALTLKTTRFRKVIKLFRCLGCEGCFGIQKMSGYLIICKKCNEELQTETTKSRYRLAEKVEKSFGKFLRGRLCR